MEMIVAIFWVENVHFKLIQKMTRRCERHTFHLYGCNIVAARCPDRTVE
jgi:hypothetical protein